MKHDNKFLTEKWFWKKEWEHCKPLLWQVPLVFLVAVIIRWLSN